MDRRRLWLDLENAKYIRETLGFPGCQIGLPVDRDDTVVDGNIVYTIVLGTALSTDDPPLYHGLDPTDVSVTNTDNEIPPTKFSVVNDASANLTYEYGGSGNLLDSYSLNSGNSAPRGAAGTAAGDKTWVVDANKKVYVYDNQGVLQGSSWTAGSLASNATLEGIATNGTDVWIVDARQDRVYRYADGANQHVSGGILNATSFALNSGNRNPKDIVTDGVNIWIVDDSTTDKVFKYTLTGGFIGSWTISTSSPTGITLEPGNAASPLWIVDNANDSIYQFAQPTLPSGSPLSGSLLFVLAPGNTNPQGLANPPAHSVSNLTAPLTGTSFDSALLAVIGELDSFLASGKKRK